MAESPVASLAKESGIEVLAPPRPSEAGFLDRLRDIGPECCPVVAYGALIPQAALDIPPQGWVNLHFSLLPAWRGAAPVHHAIRQGDDITGASTFALEAGMDTGPVYGVLTEPVGARDTAGNLLGRLAIAGAALLVATLDGIEDGTLQPVPQPAEGVSFAPRVSVDDARVDWSRPALVVDRLIRSCIPAPGPWTMLRDGRLKLGPVLPVTGSSGPPPAEPGAAPGRIEVTRDAVTVGTGSAPVRLTEVQPAGRRPMPALDWARGAHPHGGRFS